MGFPRKEHWSGSPCRPPGESPQPRDQTHLSCMVGRFFTAEPPGKPTSRATVPVTLPDTWISMLALECSRDAPPSRSSYLLILLHDLSPNILLDHYLKITLVEPSLCFPLPTSIQKCIHVHTCSWHYLFPFTCFIFLHSTYHHPVTIRQVKMVE